MMAFWSESARAISEDEKTGKSAQKHAITRVL